MSEYDRFALAGGLDSSTPYISRDPGTLLQCRNFSPDSDGGYRIRGGFERFDGRLAPSAVKLMSLHVTGDTSGYLCGQTVTGSLSGAKGVIGRIQADQLWVDVQTTAEFRNGDVVGAATVSFITEEPVATSSYVPDNGEENKVLIVTPTANFDPQPGIKIRGDDSGAVIMITNSIRTPTTMWLYGYVLEGELMEGEDVREQDGDYATIVTLTTVEYMLSTPNTPAGAWYFLSTLRRQAIGVVPGTGPITGVWELNNDVYAFRNGAMYRSSSTGWQNVSLGRTLKWKERPDTVTDDELGSGDIIKGVTSGATATVGWVGYGGSQYHKEGYMSLSSVTGTFVDGEDIQNTSVGNIVIGKADGTATVNTLPTTSPKGMRFVNHNFYGKPDTWSMYGVTGNGPAFVYNPTYGFASIITGRDDETPFEIVEHKDHLFLAYNGGSIQHSMINEPMGWSGALGALEIVVGAEIRSLVSSPKSLILCTEKDVQALSGGSIDDWEKNIVTSHNGIAMFSAQYQSQTFALTRTGIAAVERTDQFGDFSDATVSDRIRNLLRPRYDICTGSLARKDKGIYYLYFSDGTNVGMASYQGNIVGFFTFDLGGLIVRGAANPGGRVWFYSDTGYIYQDDVGTCWDGREKVAAFRSSYANQGDPDTRKRYRRADITFSAERYVNVLVNFTFDKGAGDSLSSIDSGLISTNGGRWDVSNWNQVFWDASEFPSVATDIDGIGFDISTMIYVSSRIHPDFVVEDVSLEWTARRKVR